ncbi:hypothetical protein B0H10DRAFT_2216019 [Mycena sp. CBHHK59/15]|nr:hypothetical protein B0H10DRAFT_2216019 [Mycena sp. CBHHK59/15]
MPTPVLHPRRRILRVAGPPPAPALRMERRRDARRAAARVGRGGLSVCIVCYSFGGGAARYHPFVAQTGWSSSLCGCFFCFYIPPSVVVSHSAAIDLIPPGPRPLLSISSSPTTSPHLSISCFPFLVPRSSSLVVSQCLALSPVASSSPFLFRSCSKICMLIRFFLAQVPARRGGYIGQCVRALPYFCSVLVSSASFALPARTPISCPCLKLPSPRTHFVGRFHSCPCRRVFQSVLSHTLLRSSALPARSLCILCRLSLPIPSAPPSLPSVAYFSRLYYVLRDDLLAFYVGDVEQRLAAGGGGWEEIEATLQCILSIHEALDLEHAASSPHLARLFAPALLARLPDASAGASPGVPRTRCCPRWGTRSARADADGALCLQAALALRSLCDASRDAFAEVHAGRDRVPDSDKGTVLQSIARAIQALPPAEEGAPIEAMVNPARGVGGDGASLVFLLLRRADRTHAQPLEDARVACISRLEILADVAKGLARTTDPLPSLDDAADGAGAELAREARAHPRTVALFEAIQRVADLWSEAAEVGRCVPLLPCLMLVTIVVPQALSELFKAITSLPADTTAAVHAALAEIVHATVLGAPGGMTENLDIVQGFFACIAQDSTSAFYTLPDGTLDALMQCTVSALALLARRRVHIPRLPDPSHLHGRAIMRAVLCGFAGVAPRTTGPNLIELLTRFPNECRVWIPEDFVPSTAGPEAKDRFLKAVVGSRSMKRTK